MPKRRGKPRKRKTILRARERRQRAQIQRLRAEISRLKKRTSVRKRRKGRITARARRRLISEMRNRIRSQAEIIRTLTRDRREVKVSPVTQKPFKTEPQIIAKGSIPIRDKQRHVIGYEFPPILRDTFLEELEEGEDFEDFDWDELEEEIGDEDDDSYGEEET